MVVLCSFMDYTFKVAHLYFIYHWLLISNISQNLTLLIFQFLINNNSYHLFNHHITSFHTPCITLLLVMWCFLIISTLLLRFSAVSIIPEGNLWPFNNRTFKGCTNQSWLISSQTKFHLLNSLTSTLALLKSIEN